MKKRIAVFLNFVAFNLLFFSLYLNFIDKDMVAAPVEQQPMQSSMETFIDQKIQDHTKRKKEPHAANVETVISKKGKKLKRYFII